MNLQLSDSCFSKWDYEHETFLLQLPWNWYHDFSGFLIYIHGFKDYEHLFIIKDMMDMDYEDDVLQVFDGTPKIDTMGYISFDSLRHTSWWNSNHNIVSFSIKYFDLKVELVPRKSKGGSTETPKGTTNCSEFWVEVAKNRKTFEIKHDSKSSIEILWCRQCS